MGPVGLAGNPLGIKQRHGAGLGGHGHLHVKETPRGVGGVHLQLDGCLRVQGQPEEGEKSNCGNTHAFDSINGLADVRVR